MTVPVLKTERMTLRPLVAVDAGAIVDALNHLEITRWLTVVPFPYSFADAQDFLHDFANDPQDAHWAIDLGQGLIGVISAKPELGYWLHSAHHGQGLVSEAAVRVAEWYFETEAGPLESGFHLGNGPSERILRKLGFEPGDIVTKVKASTGNPVDIQTMWLTRARWDTLRSQGQ